MPYMTIRTGRTNRYARFYPSRFQLDLYGNGAEERIDLGVSGSRVLELLLNAPGKVVPREALLNHAWSDRIASQGSLTQQIDTLRQVLADETQHEIIQTLPRRGYRFNPLFLISTASSIATSDTQEERLLPIAATPPCATGGKPTPDWPRPWLIALCSPIAIGLCITGLLCFQLSEQRLHTQDMQLGTLTITYLDEREEALRELVRDTAVLNPRLQSLVSASTHLLVFRSADFYEIVCLHDGRSASWLMVQRNIVDSVPEAQLARCLQ
ncbi:winged helix-turn-helix domain-containing protein [Aquipseudomonas alcaligenes]